MRTDDAASKSEKRESCRERNASGAAEAGVMCVCESLLEQRSEGGLNNNSTHGQGSKKRRRRKRALEIPEPTDRSTFELCVVCQKEAKKETGCFWFRDWLFVAATAFVPWLSSSSMSANWSRESGADVCVRACVCVDVHMSHFQHCVARERASLSLS